MDDLQSKIIQAGEGLQVLQKVQEGYDEVGWMIKTPSSAKLRHIVIHLSMTVGSLSAICEGQEHHEFVDPSSDGSEVVGRLANARVEIGHLLVSAVQLGNLAGLDLAELMRDTYIQNAKRFAPDSEFARL